MKLKLFFLAGNELDLAGIDEDKAQNHNSITE